MKKSLSNYTISIVNLYEEFIYALYKQYGFSLLKLPSFYNIKKNNRVIVDNNQKPNQFIDYVSYFDYVIKTCIPYDLLNNYFDNMDDLSICGILFQYGDIVNAPKYGGVYRTKLNMVLIDIRDEKELLSIYHELFHVASTNRMDSTNMNSGLTTFYNGRVIGSKLNEGYTDLMTYRYFKQTGYQMGYPLMFAYVNKLEEIVGKEIMEKAYLTANPKLMVDELLKYNSIQDVMHFIDSLDLTYELKEASQVEMLRINLITFFLIQCYIKKLLYNGENLMDPVTRGKINAFSYQLPVKINGKRGVEYKVNINNIIEEAIANIVSENQNIKHGIRF